jgi:hypothetical protein
MNYLKYIELSAENLQFYLWFRNYAKRFNDLPESEKALAPEWLPEQESETPARPKRVSPETAAIFKGTDFANESKVTEGEKRNNPFSTPPHTPNGDATRVGGESMDSYEGMSITTGGGKSDHAIRASDAFETAGLKWKPRKLSQSVLIL